VPKIVFKVCSRVGGRILEHFRSSEQRLESVQAFQVGWDSIGSVLASDSAGEPRAHAGSPLGSRVTSPLGSRRCESGLIWAREPGSSGLTRAREPGSSGLVSRAHLGSRPGSLLYEPKIPGLVSGLTWAHHWAHTRAHCC